MVNLLLLIIRVPIMPFQVFDKLRNEIQNFIVRSCFYLNMKNEIQILGNPHSFFIFIKNGQRNTVRFSFFIFMNELKNELLKNIIINIVVIFTSKICTLFKSEFVSSLRRFSVVQWSFRHNESSVQKTSDIFWCLYYWLQLSYLRYSYSQLRYKTY